MEVNLRAWFSIFLLFEMSYSIIILNEDTLGPETRTRLTVPLPRRSHVNITRIFNQDEHPKFIFKRIKPLKTQRRIQNNEIYEIDEKDSVVVEAENNTLHTNDVPDAMHQHASPAAPAADSANKMKQDLKCIASKNDGICLTKEMCHKRGGIIGNICKHEKNQHCCTFSHTCGDSSSERISYFRSPPNSSSKSQGSLACDYDVILRKETCAVRVEYIHVTLARKLGGVCDIDQIYILNSVDGPTTGQCGPLNGYTTTVAVNPKQNKPLKIALLIQNDVTYNWAIKTTQLSCNEINNFVAPRTCGMSKDRATAESHFTPTYTRYSFSFQPEEIENKASNDIWWNYPEPIFNMYHYSSTKKYLLQEKRMGHPGTLMKKDTAERRIVGGVEAGINEFPWQVAIALDDMFFCGGALINENFVLTAAHCVLTRDTPVEDLLLHLGDHNLMTTNETVHVSRGVKQILFHSHFHPFLLDNDIALLELNEPVTFSDNIQPICLPDPNETYTSKKATVVGWGITSYPMGTPSAILQKIQVEVVSNFHCSRIIEESVGPGMICAAPPVLQGTCFGDSGGPLSIETETGKHILVGIVSYGLTGCALVPAFPDIYTRVSEYVKWIAVNAM
ncbi:uncharacterized protein LOC135839142 [Planococcus citri]|uniref:uncharacterized protein LOC135839142 n=1 Tax=Planococcus citri TaxID=170843 RepID=UPI0031F973F9